MTELFTLEYRETGEPVLDRNGQLFTYSTLALARVGRRVLAKDRGVAINISDQ